MTGKDLNVTPKRKVGLLLIYFQIMLNSFGVLFEVWRWRVRKNQEGC